ncbi:MAG: glucose-6-phosphate isomerase [Bdellovibrionales bacterium]|nr:glucose-6-phosphate isomerase [Bdellovibrionales bacterium]
MSRSPKALNFQLSIDDETMASPVYAEAKQAAARALDSVMARTDLGFTKLPFRESLLAAVEYRAREIARSSTHMVVLGMGGSSLGGRALLGAVPYAPGRGTVTFIDNIDCDRFWVWLKAQTDLSMIHWVIVSKSGNTMETLAMADLVDQHLRVTGHRRLGSVSTAVSELKDNPLTAWARKESVPVLEIPIDVGGRFSVLSAVGLLPAVFSGLRLERMMVGAKYGLESREIVIGLTAQAMMSLEREEWITMLWSYADGLREFGLWWQQLWAESLAKKVGRNGAAARRASTPIAAQGANDQHSLLQQVIEGARDKFFVLSESRGLRRVRTENRKESVSWAGIYEWARDWRFVAG